MKKIRIFLVSASIFSLVIGAVLVFGRREWFPDFYNPLYMGAFGFIMPLFVLLPQIIWKSKSKIQEETLIRFLFSVGIALISSGFGGLGLYRLYSFGFEYDKLIHFFNPLILVLFLVPVLEAWRGWTIKKSLWVAGTGMFVAGIGFELWEVFSDFLFGTQTLGYYGELVARDTSLDVVMNALGILFAYFYLWHCEYKKNISKKRFKNVVKLFVSILVIGLAIILGKLGTESSYFLTIVSTLGYLGLFGVSILSGFNLAIPIPVIAFFPAFVEAGLNSVLVVLTITLGMTIGDALGYLVGSTGRILIRPDKDPPKLILRLEKICEMHKTAAFVALFLYASFVPFPNEILVVPLAFLGYRFRWMLLAALLGNFVFNSIASAGVARLFMQI